MKQTTREEPASKREGGSGSACNDLLSVVSFGGGINSTALLIGLHERGQTPDLVMFADTGGEKPETYEHIAFMVIWCGQRGMPIRIVAETQTLEDDCRNRETLPGKVFGFGSCSEHFKIRPQRRYLREQGIDAVTWLVGFHAGEQRRAWRGATGNDTIRYPLIEWGWHQEDCIAAIKRHGMSVPVKSACFYCPSMTKREVLRLRRSHPELFERAIEMERDAIESGNLQTVKGLGRHWSWEQLATADAAQLRLFEDCQVPLCDVCFDG